MERCDCWEYVDHERRALRAQLGLNENRRAVEDFVGHAAHCAEFWKTLRVALEAFEVLQRMIVVKVEKIEP